MKISVVNSSKTNPLRVVTFQEGKETEEKSVSPGGTGSFDVPEKGQVVVTSKPKSE